MGRLAGVGPVGRARFGRGGRLHETPAVSGPAPLARSDRGVRVGRGRDPTVGSHARPKVAPRPANGAGRPRAARGEDPRHERRGRYSERAFTSIAISARGTRYHDGSTSSHRSHLRTGTRLVRGGADRPGRDSVRRLPAMHVLHRTQRDGLSNVRVAGGPSGPSRALADSCLGHLRAFCVPRSAHVSAPSTHPGVKPPPSTPPPPPARVRPPGTRRTRPGRARARRAVRRSAVPELKVVNAPAPSATQIGPTRGTMHPPIPNRVGLSLRCRTSFRLAERGGTMRVRPARGLATEAISAPGCAFGKVAAPRASTSPQPSYDTTKLSTGSSSIPTVVSGTPSRNGASVVSHRA